MLKRPIRILPASDGTLVPVEIAPMSFGDACRWHKRVQPFVNSHYMHWNPAASLGSVRADVGWDWRRIYSLAATQNFPGLPTGPTVGLVVRAKGTTGTTLPVGMLTAVPLFRCNVLNCVRERAFAWYLADAPSEYYDQMGKVKLKGVATTLLDCAIQTGLDAGGDGEVLLHADPKGGAKLISFYTKINMTRLPAAHPAISLLRRFNPTEYFFMDSASAASYCQKFDHLR